MSATKENNHDEIEAGMRKMKYYKIGIHHFAVDYNQFTIYAASVKDNDALLKVIHNTREMHKIEIASGKIEITEKEFTDNMTRALKMIQSKCLGFIDEKLAKEIGFNPEKTES